MSFCWFARQWLSSHILRQEVLAAVDLLSETTRETMRATLLKMGYVDDMEIIRDEFQADVRVARRLCWMAWKLVSDSNSRLT